MRDGWVELARHTSQDGILTLLAVRSEDGDITVGFDGYSWHTHGDILAALFGGTPESATERLVQDILESRAIIAVLRVDGVIQDVWVEDDPTDVASFKAEPGEELELRYWNRS